MRVIDADAEIAKIKDEIERYKENIQQWNDNKTDRNLYDVDLKVRELERNILDCEIEIKCLKQYETVRMEEHDKEIRDKAIEELSCKLMTYFADCQLIEEDVIVRDALDEVIKSIEEIAEQMKEVGE